MPKDVREPTEAPDSPPKDAHTVAETLTSDTLPREGCGMDGVTGGRSLCDCAMRIVVLPALPGSCCVLLLLLRRWKPSCVQRVVHGLCWGARGAEEAIVA